MHVFVNIGNAGGHSEMKSLPGVFVILVKREGECKNKNQCEKLTRDLVYVRKSV